MGVILGKMEKRRRFYNLMMVILIISTFIIIIFINADSTEIKINKNKINIIIIGVVSIFCILGNLGNNKIEKRFLEDYNNLSLKDKEIIEKGIREPVVELKNILMTKIALISICRMNCVLIFYKDITKVVIGRDKYSTYIVKILAGDKRCTLELKYLGETNMVVSTIRKNNSKIIVTEPKW
jgi:hypothetical protein